MATKAWHEMTSEEFERSLKKSNITGMAAFNAGKKRRAAIKESGVDPDKPAPQKYMKVDPQYIDIGPKNFTEAMGIFEMIILDAERKGRQGIMEEIRRMGRIADKLSPALALLKECRKFTSNASRLVDPAEYDGEHSVFTDPLTLKLEAFFKECENL